MEGIKRPFFWTVLLLGSLAFIFHMVGFVAPGWIVLNVKPPQPIDFIVRPESQVGNAVNEDGDEPRVPENPEEWPHQRPHQRPEHGWQHHRPPHHGEHHYPHHHGGMGPWSGGMGPYPGQMGPHHESKESSEEHEENTGEHGRDRRHAIGGDSSDEDDGGQNFERMGDFMDNKMMKEFMERTEFDSKADDDEVMGPSSDMMQGLSPMFSRQHCGDAMKTLASAGPSGRFSLRFGLWFSHLCVKNTDDEDDDDSHSHDDDDDKDEHRHGRHKRCHCKKMSSECFFETYSMFGPLSFADSAPFQEKKDLGRRLKEHRIEGTISVVSCLVGLILGAIAFKNGIGRKWFAFTGMIAMLVSWVLISIPVIRHAKHICHMRRSDSDLLSIRPPFAAICSAVGGLLCFITMLVIAAGLCHKKRTDRKMNGFSNGLYDQTQLKKAGLVLVAKPLPEKPPLYDVSDFSDLKPSEEYEPEKKPIE